MKIRSSRSARHFIFALALVLALFVTALPPAQVHAQEPLVTGLPFAVGETWRLITNFHGGVNALDLQTFDTRQGVVRAADDGKVLWARETCVGVKRKDKVVLGYQHIRKSDIQKLKVGKELKKGDFIGYTTREAGCGGSPDSHHVHFWAEGARRFEVGSVIGGYTVDSEPCEKQPALKKDCQKYCPDKAEIKYTEEVAIPHVNDANVTSIVKLAEAERMRIGRGTARSVAYSPDGRSVAVAGSTGIWIYPAETTPGGRFIPLVMAEVPWNTNLIAVAWSPDGRELAGASERNIQVWDAASGALLRQTDPGPERMRSMAWSPDGRLFAGGYQDYRTRIWDARTGRLVRTLEGHRDLAISSNSAGIADVAWSPDGRLLVTAGYEDFRVWDTNTWRQIQTLGPGKRGRVATRVAWLFDSKIVVGGHSSGSVRIWRIGTEEPIREFGDELDDVWDLAVSPDGNVFATGWYDQSIRLWDTSSGEPRATLQGHSGRVVSLAWSPDSARLVSASVDGTVRFWDGHTGGLLRTIGGHLSGVPYVTWWSDHWRIASVSADEMLRVWEASTGRLLNEFRMGYVASISRSTDDPLAASVGSEVFIREAASGCKVDKIIDSIEVSYMLEAIAWSPDATRLAFASRDKIPVHEVKDGKLLYALEGHTDIVLSVDWSSDGKWLATGSDDNTVRVWNAETGELEHTLTGHTTRVKSVVWSPDSLTLASGSGDGTVRVWDVESGAALHVLKAHLGTVYSLAWSPDGARLASGSYDRTARIWDAVTGESKKILQGCAAPVRGLAWSPDGRQLVTGSDDGTMRIWDVAP